MTMTATAHPIDGGLCQEIDVNGRHTILTDEPGHLGGTDRGPAPHELLAAMLASCVATTIVAYAQPRNWKLADVHVEVAYDPDSTPRRADVRLYLPAELTADQVKRLRKVAQTCPATRALEAGFVFDEELVLLGSALARA
jgi:putative redox protein